MYADFRAPDICDHQNTTAIDSMIAIAAESYNDSENILAGKNLAAEKGDLTRNLGHTVQTV